MQASGGRERRERLILHRHFLAAMQGDALRHVANFSKHPVPVLSTAMAAHGIAPFAFLTHGAAMRTRANDSGRLTGGLLQQLKIPGSTALNSKPLVAADVLRVRLLTSLLTDHL